MNIFNVILNELKFKIPGEVLKVAFNDDLQNWRQAPISLDEQIMNKVIRPRVLLTCNLVGGQTVVISLEGLMPNYLDKYSMVYEIPADRVMNRTIISVLSIGYLPYMSSFNGPTGGYSLLAPMVTNDISTVSQRISDSHSSVPILSNASVELCGYNTIIIRDQQRITNTYQLRCVLANEENLNNINPRSYLPLAKLCELAVKSYIYNTLIIKLDRAYLQGGQELGSLKDYVDSLSDSEQMYQDYIQEVIKSVLFMNDQHGYNRFIKLQICPGI